MDALGRVAHHRLALAAWVATMLGATTLTPVFSGPFLFLAALICALVGGTGVLLQNWRVTPVVIVAVQLVVLAETLALLFARPTLEFGLLPWTDTAAELRGQFAAAVETLGRYRAPLPGSAELTCFATGVTALVGLAVHVITTLCRQAAWAGLLLLAMYTVPAASLDGGLPMLLFIPPAVGYILLLSSEAKTRLTRWGRRIATTRLVDGSVPAEASALGPAGRRIGLTVVAAAALLPTLLPGLPQGIFQNGISPGSGSGGSSSSISRDPTLDMGKNLRRGRNDIAFTYRGEPTYFRTSTLDNFDGTYWRSSSRNADQKVDGIFAPPPGFQQDLGGLPRKRYDVKVSKSLDSPWLPVPYPVRELVVEGDWRYHPGTLDVLSTSDKTAAGLGYGLTAYDVQPEPHELRSARLSAAPDQYTLDIPARVYNSIGSLAKQVTAGAGDNQYRQAVLLQQFFHEGQRFTYSTARDREKGLDAIEAFLFQDRTGYCVQFAASMVLMSRTLGIPARMVIGFLPGTPERDGTHTVRMNDMHAWPELYFEGTGWVRFEPTPGGRAVQPTYSQTTGPAKPKSSTSPTESVGRPQTERPERPRPDRPDAELPLPDGGNWWDTPALRWSAGGLGIAALLCVPWLVRSLVRRRRLAHAGVEGLWAEVRDTARDLRLPWSASATPRQICGELCDHLPKRARTQAVKLTRAVETARYADRTAAPGSDLRGPALAVRRALWREASRGQRWRARLLPPSWRWYLSRRGTEATGLLDRIDFALARMRPFRT